MRVWEPRPEPRTYAHRDVRRAAFDPAGLRLLTIGDFTLQSWDVATRKPVALAVQGQVHHAVFSPDGRRVAAGTRAGVRVWDAATGIEGPTLRHGLPVTHASFRPDGRWLATAGRASSGADEAALWDLASGARLFAFPHDRPVVFTDFAPDGRRLLTVTFDRVARVWDLERRQELTALRRPDATAATFSPDGTRLAVVNNRTTVAIQDARDGRTVVSGLKHDRYAIRHVAFAPDGRSILVVGEGSARLFDARTGTALTPPLTHPATSSLTHAAFSRDGRRIVTVVGGDNTARVWDAETGQALTPPIQHRDLRHGALSPDGARLVVAGGDGAAVWDLAGPATPTSDARLALRAQLVAARRIDATGTVVSLSAAEFRDAWARLRGR